VHDNGRYVKLAFANPHGSELAGLFLDEVEILDRLGFQFELV